MSEPSIDDNPLDVTIHGLTLAGFQKPHPRRCPYDSSSTRFAGRINWKPKPWLGTGLDGGLDSYNWKYHLERKS